MTVYLIFPLVPKIDSRKNVLASAKHYVGDGGTEKGINEGNTIISYEDLERIHLAPYLDCLSQGVCSVMASYSSWNGSKLHTDHFLLTELLKNKLGFMVHKFEAPYFYLESSFTLFFIFSFNMKSCFSLLVQ